LTPNGKLDHSRLPVPDGRPPDLGGDYTAPETPLQELLADIWGAVLRQTRIGVRDDFFALGGHSLLATQMAIRVRDALELDVPVRVLFENPTVATYADAVTELLFAAEVGELSTEDVQDQLRQAGLDPRSET
jgi:hypothetical protein